MQKTQNYNLNKPEAGDPVKVADFNANADIVDAALGMLNGRAKVAAGSFVGEGAMEYTLSLTFTPKFALIVSKLNNKPYVSIATPDMGVFFNGSSFIISSTQCVENGVYISGNANNSKEGNYYLAVG